MNFEIASYSEKYLNDIHDIFFATTTRRVFESEVERKAFFKAWTSYYIENWPEDFLLAVNSSDQVLGYLSGCRDSLKALDFLSRPIPSYSLFKDQFEEYPAHLHINTSPNFQGQGVGGALIDEYIERLRKDHIKGLHIVTSGDSRNIEFYRRHGFNYEMERLFASSRLRFMGQSLTSA